MGVIYIENHNLSNQDSSHDGMKNVGSGDAQADYHVAMFGYLELALVTIVIPHDTHLLNTQKAKHNQDQSIFL